MCGPKLLSPYSDSLRAGWSGYQIPDETRLSAFVQTGLGAHRPPRKMGTESLSGVKRPGRGTDYPPSSSNEVKERVEPYLYSPSVSSWAAPG